MLRLQEQSLEMLGGMALALALIETLDKWEARKNRAHRKHYHRTPWLRDHRHLGR